jgi:Na+/H+ antiporter NhaA
MYSAFLLNDYSLIALHLMLSLVLVLYLSNQYKLINELERFKEHEVLWFSILSSPIHAYIAYVLNRADFLHLVISAFCLSVLSNYKLQKITSLF